LLVKCGDGAVKLLEVQAAGGKRIKGGDFINGRKAQKGDVFHVE
jgi:methionyl-tRNA formyltransferase